MAHLSAVLILSLAGFLLVFGYPLNPDADSHNLGNVNNGWRSEFMYVAGPALLVVGTAAALLFGCTWCYRHKHCKLFTASVSQLHDGSSRQSQPPDSGFSEPTNNNISEDNNNGPISLREMQNIANNNATAYIVSENEERNRTVSRESVVEFEPLPAGIGAVPDPLAHCADWFGNEEFQRSKLQYLREISRGWFGRIVEGEIEGDEGNHSQATTATIKILNQNANPIERAQFLDENKLYRSIRHENVLSLISYCLQDDPWILIFELCSLDLHEYLVTNKPKMAILNEAGVPLRLKCEIASALSFIHSNNLLYGNLWSGNVLVRGAGDSARAVLGRYRDAAPPLPHWAAPQLRHRPLLSASSDIWSLGVLLWEICSWGNTPDTPAPLPEPSLPCPYRAHLYQVMQLCWNTNPDSRPSSAQVHALVNHLYTSHLHYTEISQDDGYASNDFEDRWQRLKPNSIPKIDEHVAIVHAPSTSMASHFTGSDQDFHENSHTVQDTLSLDLDTAVSRSSSLMSDKDPLSIQIKSESLTNLHGSLEDVRNIYLNHSENAIMESQQENVTDGNADNSDSSDFNRVDPWLKDIITDSQDDVSYYRDVSDVIKNLDNILNSEKTSSSESSHQASPSRDNLTLDCKKEYSMQSSLVKSPGISNFQSILEMTPEHKAEVAKNDVEDEIDRETIGTLNHSFERHSDTNSQTTLENLTPDTPHLDVDVFSHDEPQCSDSSSKDDTRTEPIKSESLVIENFNIPISDITEVPKLKELCLANLSTNISVSDIEETNNSNMTEDCKIVSDNKTEVFDKSPDKLNKLLDEHNESVPKKLCETSTDEVLETVANNKSDQECDHSSVNKNIQVSNYSSEPKYSSDMLEVSNSSTVYMDLSNNTNSEILVKSNNLDVKNILESRMEYQDNTVIFNNNDSTKYLDLPTVINETHRLLNSERTSSDQDIYYANKHEICTVVSSTPNKSDDSVFEDTIINSAIGNDSKDSVKVPDYGWGKKVVKLEQKSVPETLSPFESPTRSQQTDTFDENSSVVLGPFENCTLDLFKGVKTEVSPCEFRELPKEEILAFSSNFSEFNLATPSPLRDGNFLNEVPDIETIEDHQFIAAVPIDVPIPTDNETETKFILKPINQSNNCDLDLPPLSPTTPPNSPGTFLSPPPESKYMIDNTHVHDEWPDPIEDGDGLNNDIDINQIELQITAKLAMAENENNLNIEYAGPLTLEEVERETLSLDDSDVLDETHLSGNGEVSLHEIIESQEEKELLDETMKALRNELELKLPLAQSVNIEPALENDSWSGELPPPPELIVSYPGALSPILEETGHQLSAYENDRPWNISHKTDSSESYPEPCNLSTDEVTELPTNPQRDNTFTMDDNNCSHPSIDSNTYTLQKDLLTSKGETMSENSPDKTYNIHDDTKGTPIDRISQISPCLLSPTIDSSIPDNMLSGNVSDLTSISKTTVPTDAKSSKPSDTQCLSKATSIDSWCSNDTLFNVDENFDDLAMDSDVPVDGELEKEEDKSTETLHNEEEKDLSNCSTYIVHDSKSEAGDSFSPDSLTGHKKCDNPKIDIDETKNSQSKDVDSGMLVSSSNSQVPSYSNCTTEVLSARNDLWKFYQPTEMIRHSPFPDSDIFNMSSPHIVPDTDDSPELPQHNKETKLDKVDSVELTCLQDHSLNHYDNMENSPYTLNKIQSVTSTPKTNTTDDCGDIVPFELSQSTHTNNQLTELFKSADLSPLSCNSGNIIGHLEGENQNEFNSKHSSDTLPVNSPTIDYQDFLQSAELKSQSCHSSTDTSSSITKTNGGSKSSNQIQCSSAAQLSTDGQTVNNTLPNYQDFMQSAELRPQSCQISLENTCGSNTNTKLVLESSSQNSTSVVPSVSDSRSINSTILNYQDFLQSAETRPQSCHSPIKYNMASITNTDLQKSNTKGTISTVSCFPDSIDSTTPNSQQFFESAEIRPHDISPTEYPLSSNFKTCTDSLLKAESAVQLDAALTPTCANSVSSLNIRPRDLSLLESTSLLLKNEITSSELFESLSHVNLQERQSTSNSNDLNNFDKNIPNNTELSQDNDAKDDSTKENGPHDHTFDSHINCNKSYGSHSDGNNHTDSLNGILENAHNVNVLPTVTNTSLQESLVEVIPELSSKADEHRHVSNGTSSSNTILPSNNIDKASQRYATVNFLNENFEELLESNVDDTSLERNSRNDEDEESSSNLNTDLQKDCDYVKSNRSRNVADEAIVSCSNTNSHGINGTAALATFKSEDNQTDLTSLTEDFLINEKLFCHYDAYLPLLTDIRFTGPGDDCMSTSFNQESPTEEKTGTLDSDEKAHKDSTNTAGEVLKEWESDSEDSHSSNSSSGEFIWKQQGRQGSGSEQDEAPAEAGDSGSGSEGDEVEFVPSSWDCFAEPSKSSLRSLEQPTPDNKKRVVFKRQKYHCVYEYPRELPDAHVAAYLPDFSTYADWVVSSPEEAERAYGQLFDSPLRDFGPYAGVHFGNDEELYVSPSARSFASLGARSQFFPGRKPPPPDLDLTTPDSGVDLAPPAWPAAPSPASPSPLSPSPPSPSPPSPSPPSPSLGHLRHTRDRLRLPLPDSPSSPAPAPSPSPRLARVFSFVPPSPSPSAAAAASEPTFSTFGKGLQLADEPSPERAIVMDEMREVVYEQKEKEKQKEKGEGTLLDSGDEDSGIESSSKATLERDSSTVDTPEKDLAI